MSYILAPTKKLMNFQIWNSALSQHTSEVGSAGTWEGFYGGWAFALASMGQDDLEALGSAWPVCGVRSMGERSDGGERRELSCEGFSSVSFIWE
jgi:hypothetical protein